MRRCSPTSARDWRSGPAWASRAWAPSPPTAPGDIFIAFATGNRDLGATGTEPDARRTVQTRMVVDKAISPLFQAAVEAVEAAVVNALLAAETMTGRDGITAHALDHGRLLDVMDEYGRGARAAGLG